MTREVTTMRWLASFLTGLLAWSGLLGGAVAWGQEPLTLTLATNQVDFAAGQRLQVTVGVANTGLPGTVADFLVGVVLPDVKDELYVRLTLLYRPQPGADESRGRLCRGRRCHEQGKQYC